jgi:hypothetical protein
MKTNNLISLNAARELKIAEEHDYAYQARILCMDKLELLEEMVQFQEQRSTVGKLTPKMMIRGKVLFKALEQAAETQALKLLSQSYRRHLDCELKEFMKNSSHSN